MAGPTSRMTVARSAATTILRNTGKSVGAGLPCSARAALKTVACSVMTWFLRCDDANPSVTEHGVGDFCRAPHSILDAASEPQRWSGFAGRPHCQGELGGPKMLSLKSDV